MAHNPSVSEYLCKGGATSDGIDGFLISVIHLKTIGKKAHHEVQRLWERLLRHRQTTKKKHERFDFRKDLKQYWSSVTKGEVTPSEAIDANPQSFVSKLYFAINKKKELQSCYS